MAIKQNALATIDSRSYFEQSLAYGVESGILTTIHLNKIRDDGPKGIVQIANYFGTAYLQASLEDAATRMVNLISLFLADKSDSNLRIAAMSLRDNTLLSHSKGGADMLKRLNALPLDTQLMKRQVSLDDEKAFLNERSFASPMSLDDYRQEVEERLKTQRMIDFGRWAASRMQEKYEDYASHTAEEIGYSAILVWYCGKQPAELPTKAEFVKMLTDIRKASFKPQLEQFQKVLKSAPEDFRLMAGTMMDRFTKEKLPLLRDKATKPAEFIHGDHAGMYYIRESLDEEVGEFEKLVSREWVRITKGKTDPSTIATVFLLVATGHLPKATLLQKEAKAIVAGFRSSGFNSDAVCRFIDEYAPMDQRQELTVMWLEDLQPEAEVHLADLEKDDTYMDRALSYLKQNCSALWKGR